MHASFLQGKQECGSADWSKQVRWLASPSARTCFHNSNPNLSSRAFTNASKAEPATMFPDCCIVCDVQVETYEIGVLAGHYLQIIINSHWI